MTILKAVAGYADAPKPLRKFGNTILQTLDRQIETRNGPRTNMSQAFSASVDRWNSVPVILGPCHPDMKGMVLNMEAELQRSGCRVVGSISNAHIVWEGHPRVVSSMNLFDEEAIRLWNAGELSLSTGFFGDLNELGQWFDNIDPNHVLVFQETPNMQPLDKGSMINAEETMPEEDPKSKTILEMIDACFARYLGKRQEDNPSSEATATASTNTKEQADPEPEPKSENPMPSPELDEMKQMIADQGAKLAELTGIVTARDEKIASLEALNTEMKTALDQDKATRKEAVFQQILTTYADGERATDDQVKGIRESYNADTEGFLVSRLLAKKNDPTTSRDGQKFVQAEGKNSSETEEESGPGTYNQITRTWNNPVKEA